MRLQSGSGSGAASVAVATTAAAATVAAATVAVAASEAASARWSYRAQSFSTLRCVRGTSLPPFRPLPRPLLVGIVCFEYHVQEFI